MYEFNFDVLRYINNPPTGVAASGPIGYCFKIGSMDLGLLLSDGTKRDFSLLLMYVQFAETVSAAGQPIQLGYDTTYLANAAYKTYAAARDYSGAGLSVHAVVAAGDYGFVQVGGLNGWAFAASAAVAAGDVLYMSATNAMTAAATDANRLKGFMTAQKLIAGAGNFGVGEVMIGRQLFS